MSKELYIRELDRLTAKYEACGMSPNDAYDRAGDEAYDAMRDRIADMADAEKLRRKEGR